MVVWQPVREDEGFPAAGDTMTLHGRRPPPGLVQNGQGSRAKPPRPPSGGLAQPAAQGTPTRMGQRGREEKGRAWVLEKDQVKRRSQWGCQLPPKIRRPHGPLIPGGDFPIAAKKKSCFRSCSKYFMRTDSAESMRQTLLSLHFIDKGNGARRGYPARPHSR